MMRGARRTIALACGAAVATSVVAGCGGGEEPEPRRVAATTTDAARLEPVVRPDAAEADQSSPLPEDARRGPAAPRPTSVGQRSAARAEAAALSEADRGVSPGAPTDAEIRAELEQMEDVVAKAKKDALRAGPAGPLELTPKGNARIPEGAPAQVAAIIGSANAIARFPYVYGGGHGSFVDNAYDCSGSVSYALAGAGLLDTPMVSGAFEKYGEPGPGRWVTIYANGGHMFMTVAGVRYDTSGRSGVFGSRWNASPRGTRGFVVRHPPGL